MTDKFEALPEEKRLAIINAAYHVFSKNGYQIASTNAIIQEAGISKGLLFHYFKTKLNLFTYLYETSMDLIKLKIYDEIDISEPDYFNRLWHVGTVKIEMSNTYPELFTFVTAAYFDKDPDIVKLVSTYNSETLQEGYKRLHEGVDFSMFRDDLDLTLMLNTINATLQDWSAKYVLNQQSTGQVTYDLDAIHKELAAYYDFFRKSFYKSTPKAL